LNFSEWDNYEIVVGKPFNGFTILCNGNKGVAALYFGQAYWNAKGITKYDKKYEYKIELLEKKISGRPQSAR